MKGKVKLNNVGTTSVDCLPFIRNPLDLTTFDQNNVKLSIFLSVSVSLYVCGALGPKSLP